MEEEQASKQFEQTITGLLKLLSIEASVQVDIIEAEEKKYFDVNITAEDSGAELIGHHGNKLDALATVLTMMVPEMEEPFGVLVDVNGYRSQRTKYIEEMAHKAAQQVIDSGSDVVLEPMRPWERRAFHLALRDRTDITTTSEGEDPERRIIVKPADIF